jgi:hypothetical protein
MLRVTKDMPLIAALCYERTRVQTELHKFRHCPGTGGVALNAVFKHCSTPTGIKPASSCFPNLPQ